MPSKGPDCSANSIRTHFILTFYYTDIFIKMYLNKSVQLTTLLFIHWRHHRIWNMFKIMSFTSFCQLSSFDCQCLVSFCMLILFSDEIISVLARCWNSACKFFVFITIRKYYYDNFTICRYRYEYSGFLYVLNNLVI